MAGVSPSFLLGATNTILTIVVIGFTFQTYRAQKRASVRESIEQLEHGLIGSTEKLVPTLEEFDYTPWGENRSIVYLTVYGQGSGIEAQWATKPEEHLEFVNDSRDYQAKLETVDCLDKFAINTDGSGFVLEVASADPVTVRRVTLDSMREILALV